MYGLTQTSPPASEPIALATAKTWLRLAATFTADDQDITDLIADAREYVERVSGRQLVTASWQLTLDGFPANSSRWGGLPAGLRRDDSAYLDPWTIRLPKAPLQSVQSVTYYDLAGNPQTLAPTVYDVDPTKDPGVLSLAQYQIWPITRLRPGAVTISFTAGYGVASAVPGAYRRAIRMLLGLWYEHRGEDGDKQDCSAADRLIYSASNGALEYA